MFTRYLSSHLVTALARRSCAACAPYLASETSSYTTGQTIFVDGGRVNVGTTGRPQRVGRLAVMKGLCAPNPRPAMTSWRGSRGRTQGRAGATVRWVSVV